MAECKVVSRARPAILALKPYSSARSLAGEEREMVYLDANEMPVAPLPGAEEYARYAPQQPQKLMEALAGLYGVAPASILVSRGADEAIDILVRCFCEAGQDNILICPPAFPMYAQSAQWQGAGIKSAPLDKDFQPDANAIVKAADNATKIVFLCSPNNPTGNLIKQETVEQLCETLRDRVLVVADEAYIEFSPEGSCLALLANHPNLVILRTLSKAYALAGVRCGVMIAHPDLIALCRKVLAPYPIPVPVIETVLKVLQPANKAKLDKARAEVLATRDWFIAELHAVEGVKKIYPTDTNFVLVRFQDADQIMAICRSNGFVLRNQSHQPGLANCIRISMGSREQMDDLLQVLKTGSAPVRKPGRQAAITRKTKETAISVKLDLDRPDPVRIHTGIGFYDHMLEQVARHGGFSLQLDCAGDLHIDPHHTIEDCAIALGQALKTALGDKAGIGRYGFTLPMDEALAQCTIDLSGRGLIKFDGHFPESKVGDMPTDMVEHVFRSLAENMQATIHITVTGDNTHHIVEGCFKAFGRALRQAIRKEGDALPSTKGVL
jgi:histidinol-phosphate aminotransferase